MPALVARDHKSCSKHNVMRYNGARSVANSTSFVVRAIPSIHTKPSMCLMKFGVSQAHKLTSQISEMKSIVFKYVKKASILCENGKTMLYSCLCILNHESVGCLIFGQSSLKTKSHSGPEVLKILC